MLPTLTIVPGRRPPNVVLRIGSIPAPSLSPGKVTARSAEATRLLTRVCDSAALLLLAHGSKPLPRATGTSRCGLRGRRAFRAPGPRAEHLAERLPTG